MCSHGYKKKKEDDIEDLMDLPFEERVSKSIADFMLTGIGILPITSEELFENPLFRFIDKETGKEVKIHDGKEMELIRE